MKSDPENIAIAGAYMASGFLAAASAYSGIRQQQLLAKCGDHLGGHIGMMAKLCSYVPLALELAELGYEITGDSPGVWEYEIAEPFGDWYALQLLNNNGVDEELVRSYLVGMTFQFFERSLTIEATFYALAARIK
jgi:hypothetical protein